MGKNLYDVFVRYDDQNDDDGHKGCSVWLVQKVHRLCNHIQPDDDDLRSRKHTKKCFYFPRLALQAIGHWLRLLSRRSLA